MERQLLVTVSNLGPEYFQHRFNMENYGLYHAKNYLKLESSVEFAPALACFYGMSSAYFLLYGSIGFDRLNVLDLWVELVFPDNAIKFFCYYRLQQRNGNEARASPYFKWKIQ